LVAVAPRVLFEVRLFMLLQVHAGG
ncbi:MAG: hypothetical protein QOD87_837, partial [Pseudonocardiales bacterium]|nr:hypothetical protein [Pseudonocardiales bacterium]